MRDKKSKIEWYHSSSKNTFFQIFLFYCVCIDLVSLVVHFSTILSIWSAFRKFSHLFAKFRMLRIFWSKKVFFTFFSIFNVLENNMLYFWTKNVLFSLKYVLWKGRDFLIKSQNRQNHQSSKVRRFKPPHIEQNSYCYYST